MAGVSPKVINALASDKIDLACVQAFTLTGDHKRQERILKRYRTAHQVRKLLTESKLTTGSGLFRFVGTEAYQAAGGTITGDLFSAEGDGYADDRSEEHTSELQSLMRISYAVFCWKK